MASVPPVQQDLMGGFENTSTEGVITISSKVMH